jgi:hypothetical protein
MSVNLQLSRNFGDNVPLKDKACLIVVASTGHHCGQHVEDDKVKPLQVANSLEYFISGFYLQIRDEVGIFLLFSSFQKITMITNGT